MEKIGIIGCGHMGGAIAKALLAKKIGSLIVSKRHKPEFSVKWTKSNPEVVQKSHIVIIAVKPNMVADVLAEIQPYFKKNHVLISVAAGLPLKKLIQWSGGHKKIVRVLPNIPSQIFEGMSLWKASKAITKSEKKRVSNLLNCFGKSVEVKNEDLINSGCAVSGCGPAFCAAFLETFGIFAKESGFSTFQAREMALQTVMGSVLYMQKTGVEFGVLAKAVQTKGGVTEAAFKVLNKGRWQKTLTKALMTAYKKSRAIGRRR